MPHVSKYSVSEKTREKLNEHLSAFLGETSIKDRERIFQELFTKTERVMLSKRLLLLFLIGRGTPTHAIGEILKMSPSTVARFEIGASKGIFKYTSKWLLQERIRNLFVQLLTPFFPFSKRKTLSQSLDEQ